MTQKFDHQAQRALEKRILVALVDFHFREGYKRDAYVDPTTGGMYENKLATLMGGDPAVGQPTPEFTAAARSLASRGLVIRIQRKPPDPLMALLPTIAGVDKAELWGGSQWSRLRGLLHQRGSTIIVAGLTSLATSVGTILLAVAKGWFGIKGGG